MSYEIKKKIEETLENAFENGELEKLALEDAKTGEACERLSLEDIPVKPRYLVDFLKKKGYKGFQEYKADARAKSYANNGTVMIPKRSISGERRKYGACLEKYAKRMGRTSKRPGDR